jgi:hypothetical protein
MEFTLENSHTSLKVTSMIQHKPIYHSRIQKGGALLEDMRLLVRVWNDQSDRRNFSAIHKLIGKKTLARTKDIINRAFLPRFVNGDPLEAWKLVRFLEDRNAEVETLRPVYYWITARSERLLYDYVTQELIHIAQTGDSSVRIEETASWIQNKMHSVDKEWTPTVRIKTARAMLACLRDFGILKGTARKFIAPVHIPIQSFCYNAFIISKLGFSGESLVNHRDWHLFLLTPSLVERLFLDAHQHNYLSFHSAGRIYRIEFPVATHEAYADVLIGKQP